MAGEPGAPWGGFVARRVHVHEETGVRGSVSLRGSCGSSGVSIGRVGSPPPPPGPGSSVSGEVGSVMGGLVMVTTGADVGLDDTEVGRVDGVTLVSEALGVGELV